MKLVVLANCISVVLISLMLSKLIFIKSSLEFIQINLKIFKNIFYIKKIKKTSCEYKLYIL